MTNPLQSFVDPGSFRDPSGTVFYVKNEVFRGVTAETWDVMRQLQASGLLDELASAGLIVRTELVEEGCDLYRQLRSMQGDFAHFMRHERVPFISYPYEWSHCMIADAGLLQLKLQRKLIMNGFSLKDASIYNTQFIRGRPVFIDLPSIDRPSKIGLWVAYGQFCRHFLFALVLACYRSIDLRGYYLGNLEGMDVEGVYKTLGCWMSARPALFVDVFLQRHLQLYGQRNIAATRRRVDRAEESGSEPVDPSIQIINLDRLSRKVERLRGKRATTSHWVDYASINSYTEDAESAKKNFIKRFVDTLRPEKVLDLGCNTGAYSRIAEEGRAFVVAADIDPECADHLYGVVASESLNILPVCLDCANPSPGIGFLNRERTSFLGRADFDAVFALALLHHLLISSRMPLPSTCDFFASLTHRWLVIEFVGRGDSMFKHLLALREDIYGNVTRENFESVYSTRFKIVERQELPGSERSVYLLEKKDAFELSG